MAPRVALVHDFLLDLRGAERVFAAICDAWPDADVYTTIYDEAGTEGRFAPRAPRTSFLQALRPTARTFRALLPLYPHAIESLDLRGYDLVISSSSAWAHGVLVDPEAVHVCYCHNPFRYAWSEREATLAARRAPVRLPLRVLLSRWRQWDWIAAQRVDRYVANSRLTASRVRRYFGRDADVLHPPVELARFWPGEVGEHYLVVAELMAHKRIDVAVQAFNRLGAPLVVVGRRPRAAAAAAPRRADGALHRPAAGRARRRAAAERPRAGRHRGRGVRDRRCGVARVGPPGDRARLRRRARERARGGDGRLLPAQRSPRRSPRSSPGSIP